MAPPNVNIRANYPGASSETLENSVTQVIEQQLTGIDGLLYFSSNSNSRGGVNISATFAKGIDPDIAQVQVQNKVQQALPRLPSQVQQQGLTVTKSNPDFLMVAAIFDTTDTRTNQDVSDYLVSTLQEPIGRLDGVGDINVFGSQYAMRVWLNPDRLASYSLMPSDIISAITGAECGGRRGRSRRRAQQPGPGAECHRDRAEPPVHAGAVRQHRREDPARRIDPSPEGCRPGRAGIRELRHRQPDQRPSRRRHRRQPARPVPTR